MLARLLERERRSPAGRSRRAIRHRGVERVVGSVHLKRCFAERDYYCGTLRRPLDPAGQVPGTIAIAFAWLPHSDARRAARPVRSSRSKADPDIRRSALAPFTAAYAPLLDTRRSPGSRQSRNCGASDVIDCPLLQRAPLMKLHQVAACGGQLDKRSDLSNRDRRRRHGGRASSARHFARRSLRRFLGTFFVKAFAGRHPHRVRSIVLDGACPVTGADPWYREQRFPRDRAMRSISSAGVRTPCSECRDLRRHASPIRGRHFVEGKARMHAFRMSPFVIGCEPASIRSRTERSSSGGARRCSTTVISSDDAIVREAYAYDEGAGRCVKRSPGQGLFVAASCAGSMPQAYDMRLGPAERERRWRKRSGAQERRPRSPMLLRSVSISNLGDSARVTHLPLCLPWPVPVETAPARRTGSARRPSPPCRSGPDRRCSTRYRDRTGRRRRHASSLPGRAT